MNGFELLLRSMGINPEILAQTQQIFVQIAEQVNLMAAQLNRIENNTLMLLEAVGDSVPAGPTDYNVPALDRLPPMEGEKIHERPEHANGNGKIPN